MEWGSWSWWGAWTWNWGCQDDWRDRAPSGTWGASDWSAPAATGVSSSGTSTWLAPPGLGEGGVPDAGGLSPAAARDPPPTRLAITPTREGLVGGGSLSSQDSANVDAPGPQGVEDPYAFCTRVSQTMPSERRPGAHQRPADECMWEGDGYICVPSPWTVKDFDAVKPGWWKLWQRQARADYGCKISLRAARNSRWQLNLANQNCPNVITVLGGRCVDLVEDMLQSLQDLGLPASEVEPQVFGDDDGSGVPMSQLMVRAQTTVTEGSRVVFDIQFHGPLRSDIKTVHWQISTNLLPRTYRRIGGLSPVGATGGLSPVGATATQSSVPSSAAGSGGAERASPTSTPTRQRSASPQPDPATAGEDPEEPQPDPATAGEDPEEPAEKDNEIVVHVATEMLDLAALAQQNAARTGGPQESDPEYICLTSIIGVWVICRLCCVS